MSVWLLYVRIVLRRGSDKYSPYNRVELTSETLARPEAAHAGH